MVEYCSCNWVWDRELLGGESRIFYSETAYIVDGAFMAGFNGQGVYSFGPVGDLVEVNDSVLSAMNKIMLRIQWVVDYLSIGLLLLAALVFLESVFAFMDSFR